VRRYEEVEALAAHAVRAHGSLDIWVNNAGIGYIMKPLLEVSPADWSAVIDVNLTGAFFGLRVAAAHMVAAGHGGRIVNIASQAAKSGFPHAQAYTASKHGLVGLAPGRTSILPRSQGTARLTPIWRLWRSASRCAAPGW
jgi:meso-butanediol dehydrogenase/(S,S)-butanediol dehydrogenase/diacetyl reductase